MSRLCALCTILAVCASVYGVGADAGESLNVLVVFPMPSRSHSILGAGIVNPLLDAGHKVTYITAYPMKTTNKNLRQIDVGTMDDLMKRKDIINLESIMNGESESMNVNAIVSMTVTVAQRGLSTPQLQNILKDPVETFDLIIIEWIFSEVPAGLSAVFGCPFIWVASTDPHFLITGLVDEYTNPAYSISIISENIAPLSFWQRVQELIAQIVMYTMKEYIYYGMESRAYEDVFGPIMAKRGRVLPPLHEIKYNASLVLGNSHVSLGEAISLPASYKPIGGYHIPTNLPPLPEDLKKILDTAEHGVIYFSLGSNVESKGFPASIKQGLLKMFGKLKQTVLWKFEEELSGLPTNVRILNWAPQHSILAHPNCILFITHGGLLSTTETVHFGKPIIGIPVFADQYANVKRATKRGFAEHVPLSKSLVEDLAVAIDKVLGDPKYGEKARELSVVYHDRVVPPAAEVVHWAQHVVRTRGAPRLRSPALGVPLYQKLFLDLAALVLALLLAIGFLIKRVVAALFTKPKISNQKKNK